MTADDTTPQTSADWCLTHDQSVRYCREHQAAILTPLIALIKARDALLADPADRDELATTCSPEVIKRVATIIRDVNGSGWQRYETAAHDLEDSGLIFDPREIRNWQNSMVTHALTRAERAEAERDALRATVARVRALADAYDADATYEFTDPDGPGHSETIHGVTGYRQVSDAIRAALDGREGE